MRRTLIAAATLAAVAGPAGAALDLSSGFAAWVVVDGMRTDVPTANLVVFDTGGGKEAVSVNNFSIGSPGAGGPSNPFFVELSGVLNPEPFISWSIAANNNTSAPKSFVFGYTTPLLPGVSGPNEVSSQISGGLTDATGDGLTITPTSGTFLQRPTLSLNLVSGAVSAGVDSGPAATVGNGSTATFDYSATPTTPYGAGPTAGPLGLWNFLTTEIAFTLSGNEDKVAMTGNAVITPVPLPAAGVLLMSGVLTLAGLTRRRVPQPA